MTSRIRALPKDVANQIAAGEVIERPASIVKELLENSLDANASHLSIDIEEEGCFLIRVQDDGMGIHRDDLPLAILQHATSKISALSDLAKLSTMGFRGEALASIAAVSLFTLKSRCEGEPHGWQILSSPKNQEAVSVTPVAHPFGTTVEVRELFFNTPVRRKFLRSAKTEGMHIEKWVKRLALVFFKTNFKFTSMHKRTWFLPKAHSFSEQKRRVEIILGHSFLEQAFYLEKEAVGLKLRGWLAPNLKSADDSLYQSLFVNERWVKDKIVTHAIRQALSELCPLGSPLAYLLFLDCDPSACDVNVHPTKCEVRWEEPRHMHDFVWHSVREGAVSRSQSAFYEEQAMEPPPKLYASQPAALQKEKEKNSAHPLGHPLALFHNRYMLVENSEGLAILTLSKALQWLAREVLQKERALGVHASPLLMPLPISLNSPLPWTPTQESLLASFGFDMPCTGPSAFIVRKIPTALRYVDMILFVPGLLRAVCKNPAFNWNDLFEQIDDSTLFSLAHLPETKETMEELLAKLENHAEPPFRYPWIRQFTFSDLES
ncbi:MAG: DNA mismatch repair endonuclease MutL [Gammaproteobacteria bacterium]|nr:DNA mismatch repair endonuclease MutL [Gammaproteobacteria bacterium]